MTIAIGGATGTFERTRRTRRTPALRGLVRETRALALTKGRSEVEFAGVAGTIQPETVQVRALGAASELRVLEQNYQYDLLSPAKLLEKYVGRTVRVLRFSESKGRDEERDATVLSAGDPPILRVGDEITWAFPGRISFPEIPKTLIARPTLVWLVESPEERAKLEVSYLADALSWKADYVLVVNDTDTAGDLNGWVTLDNRSGAAYSNARVQLVAGDVNRVRPTPFEDRRVFAAEGRAAMAPPQFREEGLFEYHLYTLERRTDVMDRQQKQILFFEASNVGMTKTYKLRGAPVFSPRAVPSRDAEPVEVTLAFRNSAANGLGQPIPQGIVRVYKRDRGGAAQFLGENSVRHTPKDENLEFSVGRAFDVVGQHVPKDFQRLDDRVSEAAMEVELRNHKEQALEVAVEEAFHGDWTLLTSSHTPVKKDAQTAVFLLTVPANGKATLTYRVRLRQ